MKTRTKATDREHLAALSVGFKRRANDHEGHRARPWTRFAACAGWLGLMVAAFPPGMGSAVALGGERDASECAARTDVPWYHDYYTMVTLPHQMSEADVAETGADAYRGSVLWGGWYGAWYQDWQKTTAFYRDAKPRMERQFRRNVMYYDGGEVGDFVLFLGPDGKAVTDGWIVETWKGSPPLKAYWFGMDWFFKKQTPFPFPNYMEYGLKPFTDPAGAVPASAHEVLGWRDVNGNQEWNLLSSNMLITDEQAKASGLARISQKQFLGEHTNQGNGWAIMRLMTQDYANPQLRDYEAWDLARLTREIKPDGWHIDNLGDNNLFCPYRYCFGVWSEHTFRQFMKQRFPAEKLKRLGIVDIDTFDIKEYMRRRRGSSKQEEFAGYDDPKWKEDLIFKCYLINQVQESVKFHAAKFDAIKQAAKEEGIDVMVSGNLIPIFAGCSLIAGKIDVCHFEWQAKRDYLPTRRPMGLPPRARSSYITRLATAISNDNYSVVSLYVSYDLRGKGHENLYLAQGFEALANRSVMDFGHAYLDMYSPGTPRTAGIYNRFVKEYRRELSRRDFVADVGLVYDQWADVASSTAARLDVNDFFNEYAGWCDFLTDTHRQWKVLPSTTLNYEKIKNLPLVILPSALCLTDANFEALRTYLENGGRVLATGNTGLRFGPGGNLMKRSANPIEVFKKYPGFRWVMDQPAAPYWLSKGDEAAKRMKALVTYPNIDPVLRTDAEIHVGVTLSRSLPGEPDTLSLDLNNNQFDSETDRFTPTRPFSVGIRVPKNFKPPFSVTIAEPEKGLWTLPAGLVSFNPKNRTLTLAIEPFECYRFVQIRTVSEQAAEHDAKWGGQKKFKGNNSGQPAETAQD